MKLKKEKASIVSIGFANKTDSNGQQQQRQVSINILSSGRTNNNNTEDKAVDSLPIQDKSGTGTSIPSKEVASGVSPLRAKLTLIILLCANLLNFMDRFTLAGVLIDIRHYYHDLGNSEAGIIQTAFICTFMICSPVFGYLGDRYSRKYIMSCGIFLWSGFTLASSFVPNDYFYLFVLARAMVGVGEASYATVAPTLISDLFAKDQRSKALMVFYFAIPVGSGLGYIVGSNIAKLFHGWQWALRATPILGVICVILILLVCADPPRGMSEEGGSDLRTTSLLVDIKALVKIKSYIFSSLGATCVAFVTGALGFMAPSFMMYATQMQHVDMIQADVDLIFGGITVSAGFIGVALGVELARRYRTVNPRADPLLCAFGLMTCVPFLFFTFVLSGYDTLGTWILIFLAEVLLCINWAVNADILLYVVIPTRRSLAASGQILTSHALGDAISPYILGQISDTLASEFPDPDRPSIQFMSLRNASYLNTFICVLGGAFYLTTALFLEKDKKEAENATKDAVTKSNGEIKEAISPPTYPCTELHRIEQEDNNMVP